VCPDCSGSKSVGEKKIWRYLEYRKIEFVPQKWFPECKDKRPLPFDFYLPDCNTIIEFDGRQHFGETNYFTYSYEETKKHDEIKNNYCKANGIYLIRIPYWNIDKIEQILDKELISHEDIV
jgi:very-short-patch-repair endonuclease